MNLICKIVIEIEKKDLTTRLIMCLTCDLQY